MGFMEKCAQPLEHMETNERFSKKPKAVSMSSTSYASFSMCSMVCFYLNMFLTTNHTFAGRSARRRMYHGNQYSP